MASFYTILVALTAATLARVVAGNLGRIAAFCRCRRLLIAILTGTALMVLADPALAAYVENSGFTYRTTNGECTYNHVYLSDTTGKPHLDSSVQNHYYNSAGMDACDPNTYQSVAAGLIRISQDLLVYYGTTGWSLCNSGAWYYNQSYGYSLSTSYNFSYPCGYGSYYEGRTTGDVWNGSWLGGTLTTKSLYV